jgi:hypothetical protein
MNLYLGFASKMSSSAQAVVLKCCFTLFLAYASFIMNRWIFLFFSVMLEPKYHSGREYIIGLFENQIYSENKNII